MKSSRIGIGGKVGQFIHCDASGCEMFASYYGEGRSEFGWPQVRYAVNGEVTTKDYCMSCYLRSEGFGV